MSQVTNLNVSPYFDDFDANNDYYKVLFKPGYAVQARELTTLQSILQNQIEKFGSHFFKEGAKVIPGNVTYNQLYYAVELNNSYLGVPIDVYVDQLIGTKITGETSGVTATVEKILLSSDSERGNTTLYINYLSSSTQNNTTLQFFDGENLYCDTTITSGLLGNTSISAGTPFAVTLDTNSTSIGSAFSISEGVYFVRGTFVRVSSETLILDQYNNKPNYRVGLFVNEEIINSDIDETLNDNSQGFNNYAAPGADRLKISVSLFKKDLSDYNDNNFIELATINDGVLRSSNSTSNNYNLISDELAKRTYAESGDYYVTPFNLTIKESLNDGLGNGGIFNSTQFTYNGAIPSEELAIYQISPGRAFVKGYDVETISSTFLDVPKPRTTNSIKDISINYNTGSTLTLNRVYGSPIIGIGNTYVLSLRDSRVGSSSSIASGKEIGLARIYDFRLESGSYDALDSNLNQWNISLYDVQTTVEITLNEPITLQTPSYFKGKNSGATAFLKDSVTNSQSIVLYQKSGDFIPYESFIIDGVENTRVAIAVTSYGISDVKSVFGIVGSARTFNSDVVQSELFNVGIVTITASSGGISTVKSTNSNFPGKNVKVGDIVKYTNGTSTYPIYARVNSVSSTDISISTVTAVSGINDSVLPTSTLNVYDFKIMGTNLSSSSDDTLYTVLPRPNISDVNLTEASLIIRKYYNVTISGNKLSTELTADANETFLPYDEERYSLIRSDGSTEILASDKFEFSEGSTKLQLYGLGTNDSATLIATLRKINPKVKNKLNNRVNSLIIDKSIYESSGIGSTTLNDGLLYGNYPYGTRVQDENISLNVPDIIQVYGVYESSNTQDPYAPTVVFSSLNGPTNKTTDLIIGEKFVGQVSGSIGIYAERVSDSEISFILLNNNTFKEGETVIFEESKIQGVISTLLSNSNNVSSNYTFDNGQRGSYYGYGILNRISTASAPSKKIKIYYSNAYYNSTDNGDITTINSYTGFNYKTDIQTVNSYRNSDIIDIRPRVSNYTVSQNLRSPLEFYGRLFNESGNSANNILASDESFIVSFSYYLGRIDRIFITKNGTFQVKYGTPSERPEKPVEIDDALEIGSITLPPYLFDISQASINFLDYKRYRMVDIKKLEDRIKSLEYYTSLSLLESNTSSLFIPDSSGLNRFKSGFFVDNFSSFIPQEDKILIKNSIDFTNNELRPTHYTTEIDLIKGPVEGVNPENDLSFEQPQGFNIRENNGIITLDYSEKEWLKQPFATRTENVTPFIISFWQGNLELTPSTDTWVDTVILDAKTTTVEGNYSQTLALASKQFDVDPQSGYSPTVWGSWETNWTGREVIETTENVNSSSTSYNTLYGYYGYGYAYGYYPYYWKGYYPYAVKTNTVTQNTYEQVQRTGTKSRTGTVTFVSEQYDTVSTGTRVVSRDLVQYMRSRNIQFISKNLKPQTQFYTFFDGIDVTNYCVPKLLEITMLSGTFQVGETVFGSINKNSLSPGVIYDNSPQILFRVAQLNHKEGPYNSPTTTYTLSPYTNQIIPSVYSSTSNLLNVDTSSLCSQVQGEYRGWVQSGMTLVGKTSGALATITSVRLISDSSTTLIGSFYIPDPTNGSNPRFETGSKTFTLINNTINDKNLATSVSEGVFTSSGTIETTQEEITSTRNGKIEQKQVIETENVTSLSDKKLSDSQVVSSTTRVNSYYNNYWYGGYPIICYNDPLAQSFVVEDSSGIFLTRCELFFKTKDNNDIPVWVQIRTMQGGYPSQIIIPFSEVLLNPDQVNTSNDGSVATSITFKTPIYLEGGKEYAIVVGSSSNKYEVFISRVGENDLTTQSYISNQPYLGSLFKSQNASTWEASQWEDLKFTLYRAEYLSSGSVEFYNPELSLGNSQVASLIPNAISLNSRKIKIGLTTALNDSGLTLGNTIVQEGSSLTAYGNYVGNAGIATGTLNVINPGIGYTPTTGSLTYNNVPLISVTGSGRNATANITIGFNGVNYGVAVAATISNPGNGYQVGDVLGISTLGSIPTGRNALFSLVSIASTNELILDNVQGDFAIVGSGGTVQYINNSGITTTLNYSVGGNVQIEDIIIINDGSHMKVHHKNHGMYFKNNFVTISGVESDVPPTKLSSDYSYNSTSSILVEDSGNFTTFENIGVSTSNPGYAMIGYELFQYESVSSGSLNNVTRIGYIDPTYFNVVNQSLPHSKGSPVYKYELNGVSLQRINRTHSLNNVTINDSIEFDSYYIKILMDSNGVDRLTGSANLPNLYFNQTKSSGGFNIKSTQNISYEMITPMVQNITVQGTSINGEIRTVSGSSISGNEIPYIDKGYQAVALNKTNYLDSTRLITSKVNSDSNLTTLPGKKSLNMRIFLNSVDSRLSPIIDTQRVYSILTSNRVNDPVDNFATDNRINSLENDPSSFIYISKEMSLENSATSLKVFLDAHINTYCDVRALYSISENSESTSIFTPFPGYNNLDQFGQIINFEDSDGLPDVYVTPSSSFGFDSNSVQFKEYVFTANSLPSFRYYRIKLIFTSKNQVYVPRGKNLRVIALA